MALFFFPQNIVCQINKYYNEQVAIFVAFILTFLEGLGCFQKIIKNSWFLMYTMLCVSFFFFFNIEYVVFCVIEPLKK